MNVRKLIKGLLPYGAVRLYQKQVAKEIVCAQEPLQYCPLCDKWSVFGPCGIGDLHREHGVCLNCGSLERHRALFYVYQVLFMGDLGNDKKIKLLHFAPEKSLSDYFMANDKHIEYSCCDLYPNMFPHLKGICQKQDALNTSYSNGQFDVIVANHLIEHISEGDFLKEMRRILSPVGTLIISMPVYWEMEKTFEDPTLATTPEDRLKYFGQEDHIRKYGADVIERLANYFEVMGLDANALRPYGDIVNTNVFVCRHKR